ncbi:Asp-tRNA(Asn)/Glu-tRNA(Gln) amidotransferase subunit GatA [Sedimentibacter sp. MB31-C6]|uniref:Asp-tRNA(Asn)/Glu-tRNA(Gln) amidotransferase subunit GatA n=1 Tax=Sedimentibacter sp. MB31-C6 TaxID=3109366 RepID=UPI002DDCEF87|nr:Asp-tRNA(Asn)/Glu-tRNA(Gln) amidotransferase subunit GatA [Sedimentibacter sp. MB36-C1]WSI03341.1 Asp-tRNA(Asn)/Glu-tRNA(Gln) amidotransferase subunit GatA [Sedimentibacter sp. MB36-C1]
MEKTISKIKYIKNLLETKQVSCIELTNKYLESIETENKILNAYVKTTEEIAIATAKSVDDKISKREKLKPLEGIPMTLKDNISTKDVETTCCSRMLKGYIPIYDATVWSILKGQNAVLLGKTNMDEFAMGSSCETSCFGGAINPHNSKYVAGGSSGGVASAVGGNIAVYGLGSDTGGSIRQPASFCGLVGLKPTYGAISRYGLIAYASSLEQIGPIAKTVEDTALVYDSLSIYDTKDATSQGNKGQTAEGILKNSIKGIKIGIVEEYFEGVRSDIKESINDAIKVYEDLGAEIIHFKIPQLKYSLPVYYIIACAEASSNLGRYDGIRYGYKSSSYDDINDMICKTRSGGFGKEVQRRILLGTYVLSAGYYDDYYKKAQKLRGSIVKAFREAFDFCDVILAPTVPKTAFELNYTSINPIETYMTDICTVAVNIAGLPAVSVPCGLDNKGLPIGMQIIGNIFDDAKILNVAYKYEQQSRNNIYKDIKMGVSL